MSPFRVLQLLFSLFVVVLAIGLVAGKPLAENSVRWATERWIELWDWIGERVAEIVGNEIEEGRRRQQRRRLDR